MTVTGFIILLIIAGLAGALGQAIGGYSQGGCIVSIILGFVGAVIGTWLANQFGLPTLFAVNIDGQPFPIVWAIIGAAIFSAIVGLLFGPRRRAY
jgi:uncharacterized membrane protein YeaQ/YmgE (transglycosylase-associated protein family)